MFKVTMDKKNNTIIQEYIWEKMEYQLKCLEVQY